MAEAEPTEIVRGYFDAMRPSFQRLARGFVDDPAAVVERAAVLFEEMIPTMAYLTQPHHPLASAVFGCNAHLAMHVALRERDVDAHAYGQAMLEAMTNASHGPPVASQEPTERPEGESPLDTFIAAGRASQEDAAPGEFVFEAFRGEGTDLHWGMNVTSCAICSSYSAYDAMDLVPYMCATDDVSSDRGGEGLRRTGTIAVGAHQCDFRYKRGRSGEHLAERYPDKIRVKRA